MNFPAAHMSRGLSMLSGWRIVYARSLAGRPVWDIHIAFDSVLHVFVGQKTMSANGRVVPFHCYPLLNILNCLQRFFCTVVVVYTPRLLTKIIWLHTDIGQTHLLHSCERIGDGQRWRRCQTEANLFIFFAINRWTETILFRALTDLAPAPHRCKMWCDKVWECHEVNTTRGKMH